MVKALACSEIALFSTYLKKLHSKGNQESKGTHQLLAAYGQLVESTQ